tara:strand:+ start:13700 stop:14194 length:495 start_codon:yes stop_codon:yes gene_type:complete
VPKVSWTLYDDIVGFLQKYKERLSSDELTTLFIVSDGYLVKEELTRKAIEDARRIMARYESGEGGFDPNDRTAIEAALADPDADNPIAMAIAERLKELTGRYWLNAETLGRVPTELLLVKPRTAFEEIVYQLHLQTIADTTGQTVKVVWVESEDEADAAPVAAE